MSFKPRQTAILLNARFKNPKKKIPISISLSMHAVLLPLSLIPLTQNKGAHFLEYEYLWCYSYPIMVHCRSQHIVARTRE